MCGGKGGIHEVRVKKEKLTFHGSTDLCGLGHFQAQSDCLELGFHVDEFCLVSSGAYKILGLGKGVER